MSGLRGDQRNPRDSITVDGVRYEFDNVRGKWLGDRMLVPCFANGKNNHVNDLWLDLEGASSEFVWVTVPVDSTVVGISGRVGGTVTSSTLHLVDGNDVDIVSISMPSTLNQHSMSRDVDIAAGEALRSRLEVLGGDRCDTPCMAAFVVPRLVV